MSVVVDVSCALIERDGRVLVAQRSGGKLLPGKWEFPGGKVEPRETPERSLLREIAEELGCGINIVSALSPATHQYPELTIRLIPFRCALVSGEPRPLEHAALRWLRPGELRSLDWAPADLPILAEYLKLRPATAP